MSTAVVSDGPSLTANPQTPSGPPSLTRPRTTPRWWRDVTAALAWVVVMFVVALWVSGDGLTDFGSVGDGLTSVGRLAGLLASALILLQVLLMARIPIVEQAWGQDELARVHRLVGFTSFTLMLVHIGLVIVGYSVGTGVGLVGTFLDEVLHSPGMLLALAGALRAGYGCGDVGEDGPAAAALRVVAPAAPLRLHRGRAGAAAPAVERRGLPGQHGIHRVLVGSLRRCARLGARLPGGGAVGAFAAPPPRGF